MMLRPSEIVDKQLEFYNKNNLEDFISTYDDKIIIYSLSDNSIMIQGKKELEKKYQERFEVFKVHADIQSRIEIGNKVIDHEYVTGLKKDSVVKAVAIYEVKNNLIKRVWFLFE